MDTTSWNGDAGRGWVAAEAALDAMFAPFDDLLLEGAVAGRVLDVGCGSDDCCAAAQRWATRATAVSIRPRR